MFCKQEPGRGIPVCFCLVPSEERQARSSGFPETGSVSRKTKVTNVTSFVSFSSAIFFFLSPVLGYVSTLLFTNLNLKFDFVVMQKLTKRVASVSKPEKHTEFVADV